MPYGRPSSTGHGYRIARYRWHPSFDSASARRKRRRGQHRATSPRPTPSSSDFWEALEWAFGGGRIPNWAKTLLNYVVILALVVNLPFFFLFLLKPLLEGGIGASLDDAEKDMLSSMDKVTKALRIQRKTSVDPPPTPEAIRAAWEAAQRSLEGKLLAGTLLSNLEPVVDHLNSK